MPAPAWPFPGTEACGGPHGRTPQPGLAQITAVRCSPPGGTGSPVLALALKPCPLPWGDSPACGDAYLPHQVLDTAQPALDAGSVQRCLSHVVAPAPLWAQPRVRAGA